MVREGYISEEQYHSLNKKVEDLDLDKVIWEIKSVKIGRGVDFLPRETPDLLRKLKEWAMELAKDGTAEQASIARSPISTPGNLRFTDQCACYAEFL